MSRSFASFKSTYHEPWRWAALVAICLGLVAVVLFPTLGSTQPILQHDHGSSASAPLTWKDAEKSLIKVNVTWTMTYDSYSKAGPVTLDAKVTGLCTGFFVDDDTAESASIATAAHCVDENEIKQMLLSNLLQQTRDPIVQAMIVATPPEIQRSVRVSQPLGVPGAVLGDEGLLVQVIGLRPDDDVALLRLNLFPAPVPTLKFASGTATVGDTVVAAGFPGNIRDNVDEIRQAPSVKEGQVSSRQVEKSGVAFMELSAPMTQGMSGGPAFNSDYQVIGIISHGVDQQAFNFVTDTEGTRNALQVLAKG